MKVKHESGEVYEVIEESKSYYIVNMIGATHPFLKSECEVSPHEVWVSRDRDNDICFYGKYPGPKDEGFYLDDDTLFEWVTHKNSPIKLVEEK